MTPCLYAPRHDLTFASGLGKERARTEKLSIPGDLPPFAPISIFVGGAFRPAAHLPTRKISKTGVRSRIVDAKPVSVSHSGRYGHSVENPRPQPPPPGVVEANSASGAMGSYPDLSVQTPLTVNSGPKIANE